MIDQSSTTAMHAQGVPLRHLLWQSYLRISLIPLLFIEVGFLATYWVSETIVYRENMETVSELSRDYFLDIAERETEVIDARLAAIASHTLVFARQTRDALSGDYIPQPAEKARYRMLPSGALYTAFDNGTTASFYAGGTNVGPKEIEKVWRLSALDPFMIATKESNPLIASIYFNTHDSYNRIYPYVDAASQYSSEMVIPSYNFYYEADAEHNPERREVWTDAYVDPAGHGWLVSSIAPVWRDDKLEGVVGIDVTLESIISSLLDLELPWDGYAVLVDQKGGIIALPPAGEKDFGLDELTEYDYSEAILRDTHKPEYFNITQRKDTLPLARAMQRMSEGDVELDLGGPRLASFATVPQTGWSLVIIAPSEKIYAGAQSLHDRLEVVMYLMLGTLLAFYLVFFAFLTRRAKAMSQMIAGPLAEISGLIDQLADRRTDATFGGSQVKELDRVGHHLVTTRQLLREAQEEADRQRLIAGHALADLRLANSEMLSFTRFMSHEIRTPLSIIDGSAQIIQRKADNLSPQDLRRRALRVRSTVATVAEMLSKLVDKFDSIVADVATNGETACSDLRSEVRSIVEAAVPGERLQLVLPRTCACEGDSEAAGALTGALRDILAFAVSYALSGTPIVVTFACNSETAWVIVTATMPADAGEWYHAKTHEILAQAGGDLALKTSSGETMWVITVPFRDGRII